MRARTIQESVALDGEYWVPIESNKWTEKRAARSRFVNSTLL